MSHTAFAAIRLSHLLLALAIVLPGGAALAHQHGDHPPAPDSLLNGSEPRGVIAKSIREEKLSEGVDSNNLAFVVMRTTRAPGTRTPIHQHDFGGTTCVLAGQMTLFLEGAEPRTAVAGECYYMPSGKRMAGSNTGTDNAVMLDIFHLPQGQPVWRVVEEAGKALQNQFAETGKP